MDPLRARAGEAARPGAGRRVAVLLLLSAIYFVAAKLGLQLAIVHASASAVWPPTGIALGGLLLLGYGAWPAIALGAVLANITARLRGHLPGDRRREHA
jgi:integral membrane sensor domain MASE1